jgi:hypothetical protein
MMISFLSQPTATVPNNNLQIPNTLSTQGMPNIGTVFAQPTQPSQFGIVPATPALNQPSSATMPQAVPSNNGTSIFSGLQPTGVISSTGVSTQQPFQFATSPLPADTSLNTVGGLNLNSLEGLLQTSNQVGQQALVNPNISTVMPLNTGVPQGSTNIVLTPEAIRELQTPNSEEGNPENTEALQAQADDLEKQLKEIQEAKSNTKTQTAFASEMSPAELQQKITNLEEQIADFKTQKTTTALQTQIGALEKELKELKATQTPETKTPSVPNAKPAVVAKTPAKK